MSKWLQIALSDELGNNPVTKLTELTKPPVTSENSSNSAVFNSVTNDAKDANVPVTKLTKTPLAGDENNIVNSVTGDKHQKEGAETPGNPQETTNSDNIVNFVNFVTVIHPDNAGFDVANIDFQEREAIIAANGTPEEWVSGYATLVSLPYPENWKQEQWDKVLINTERFLDQWGAQAHNLGWSTNDVFGISQNGNLARLDHLGLVLFLDSNRVSAMTEQTAVLQCLNHRTGEPNGSTITFYRKTDVPGSVPLWEMQAND